MLILQSRVRAKSEAEAIEAIYREFACWELRCLKKSVLDYYEYMLVKEDGDGATRPDTEGVD